MAKNNVVIGPWDGAGNAVTKAEAAFEPKKRGNGRSPLLKRPDFPHRRQMLSKIHIARKEMLICPECGWITFYRAECPKCGSVVRSVTELDERAFLRRTTGKTTCADMNKFELESVIFALQSAGYIFTKTAHIGSKPKVNKGMAEAVRRRAETVLGEHWDKRLRGYIEKVFGKSDVGFCSVKELRRCFAWLQGVMKTEEPF